MLFSVFQARVTGLPKSAVHIDNIIEGVVRVIDTSYSLYRIYNAGNTHPLSLMRYIEVNVDWIKPQER